MDEKYRYYVLVADITMDPTTPAPNPLNIDAMLGSLAHQTNANTASSAPTPTSSMINIDTMSQGLDANYHPSPSSSQSPSDRSSTLSVSIFLKKIAVVVMTILIIVVVYRFISVQYPIESKEFKTQVSGFARSIGHSVQKNIVADPSSWSGAVTQSIRDDDNSVREDIYKDQVTPLSDAITQNQSPDTQPNSPFDNIEGQISGDNDTSISSGTSTDPDFTPQEISSEGLQNTLIALKEQADLYILEHDGANTLHLSIARAISKKSDALLQDFATSQVNLGAISTEITQLEALRARLQ